LTITAGRWVASVKWVGTVNTTGATTTSSTQISFKYDNHQFSIPKTTK
jgi:hypothetical protein